MKSFISQLCAWWFATMTPARVPLTTIEARETMRKRRLLSGIVLIIFSGLFCLSVLQALTGASVLINVQNFLGDGFLLLVLWINRQGHLKCASIFYLLLSFFGTVGMVMTLSLTIPIFSFIFLPVLLILPVVAGLLLPAWGSLLVGIIENAFLCWFILYERQSQIALSMKLPADRLLFLLFSCLVTLTIAGFSAISAHTTRKAVIQADRAVELEQAHQALAQAHANLEVAHETLAMTHAELEGTYATIQKQALTDVLTGLPNHRAVIDQLGKELDRARRYGHLFSLLFFDVDRFKHVNDTYGHAVGDAVLCRIGERATRVLRGGDTLGRFGGEEFVILLLEADTREAEIIAERVRVAIANEPMDLLEGAGGLSMTVSIGMATYPADGYGEQELLQQADQAMYLAKRLGRNQVRTATEAVRMGADVELMALLQKEGEREAEEREGITQEHLRENYTVKIICSLMTLLDRRDEGMSQHAYAVSDLATVIAQTMKLEPSQVSRIGMAALLHDIGKVAIPDVLLQKKGPLTPDERGFLQEHAELGAQILEASPFLYDLMPAVRHHHERWDGNGYPDHLAGEDIPLAARIIGVAEAYDVMVSGRPYQTSCTPDEALVELRRCAGTQFDPVVAQALLEGLAMRHEQHYALQVIE